MYVCQLIKWQKNNPNSANITRRNAANHFPSRNWQVGSKQRGPTTLWQSLVTCPQQKNLRNELELSPAGERTRHTIMTPPRPWTLTFWPQNSSISLCPIMQKAESLAKLSQSQVAMW